MRVLHIITRMIIGGAQENTLYNCLDLAHEFRDEVILATGPSHGPEGCLLDQGRAGDLTIETIPSLRRSILPWSDVKCYGQLRRLIRRVKPDVVHTHSAKAGFLGRLASWKERVPAIVHTVHGAPFHPYQSSLARETFIRCERFAAGRCHQLISVADAMTDLMVDADVAPRKKFVTIYSGMETEPFLTAGKLRAEARKELGISPDEIVIGKIARLFRLKGHEDLLLTAAEVAKEIPTVRFLFVGDGELRDSLERQAAELGLSRHIIFRGLVDPKEIPRQIAAMDILTHTSLREGLARTLPQALLSGIPVVSYDIDGAREVCIDGETGYLVTAGDTQTLARRLIDLSRAPELRKKLGMRGQSFCRERFSHHVMTDKIRGIYQKLLTDQDVSQLPSEN
ncbi:MAG: glycosyltransferase family 4 protein [Planctomycetota bacterium]|nr:glycosyltransferase family 4 protein [Planctomycetota bacterium]